MTKKILPLILILVSLNVFAQIDLKKGFIVLESTDTISGTLIDKNYYAVSRVQLYQDNNTLRYPKKILTEIHVDTDNYVKSDMGIWSQAFYKKEIAGNINLYTYKKSKRLGGFDSDINSGRLIPAIKFYCDDYPGMTETIKIINKENVDEFIAKYNDWKSINPESKSYFKRTFTINPLLISS